MSEVDFWRRSIEASERLLAAKGLDPRGYPIVAGGDAREQGACRNGGGTPSSSAPGLEPGRSAHNPPATSDEEAA